MSRYYEFEGKNIDDAVRNASETLKIERNNLRYEVVQSGSGGFLGLVGKKLAKIRVMRSQENDHLENGQAKEAEAILQTFEKQKPSIDNEKENQGGADSDSDANQSMSEVETKVEHPLDLAQNALKRILDSITSDCTITVVKREPIELMVNGPYPGVIIGKHGQTLDAIQYLVEKIVSRKCKKHIRLEIDVEGYLKRRRENLIKLAQRLSEKAKTSRKPITIGVLNAQERRIVHIALKEKPGVRTQSVGSGVMRKIIVYPQKNNHPNK